MGILQGVGTLDGHSSRGGKGGKQTQVIFVESLAA